MHYLFRNIPHGKAKNGNQINTRVHYDYITREGKYAHMSNREEDLVFSQSGNMPVWADSPQDFWQACEENKPAKARGYREFLLGLQEELSLEDNIDCIEKLLDRTGIKDRHAYSYAVHDKTAAFDNEHRNIHCHLMFNEKIIEHDRPLGPERYFRRYSVNQEGELSGGYKISRQYQSKADILELRKTWAEIVNAKFAEKGLSDCHIDERTLKTQHDELIEQGKTEEAALIDRTPAPHLGNAYLNPRVMERIKDTVQEAEEKQANGEEIEIPENIDEAEKNILLFAKDFLLRKLAKNIQKERQEALREQKKTAKNYTEKDYQSDKAAAYVITNSDLSEQVSELIETTTQTVDSYKEKIATCENRMLSKKQIYQQAYEVLFKNEYAATITAYAKVREKITAVSAAKKAFDNAVIARQAYDRDQYTAVLKELNALYNEQHTLGKKVSEFKAAIATDAWQKKKAKIVELLYKRNKAYYLERRKNYGLMLSAKKKLDRYNKLKDGLDSLPADTVIYAEKIPGMLNKHTLLNGNLLVDSLPKYKHNDQTYYVLGTEIRDGKKIAKAVRVYDNVIKGKVPVYELSLGKPVKHSEYHFAKPIAPSASKDETSKAPEYVLPYVLPKAENSPANTINSYEIFENPDSKTTPYEYGYMRRSDSDDIAFSNIFTTKNELPKALEYNLSNTEKLSAHIADNYELRTKPDSNVLCVLEVNKTEETICTYAKSEISKNKSNGIRIKLNHSQKIHQAKATELIDKMTESRDIKIPIYWKDDIKKPIDELQRTEMQMYAGWSL